MKDSFGLFERIDTKLPGCYEILPIVRKDNRGSFVKTVHSDAFLELGLEFDFKEEYYSSSVKGVVRGLHFQIPPAEHVKLVYCVEGSVMDVAVDLRKSSSTYGMYHICHLDSDKGNMFYLPKGFAHGFYTLSDRAVMMYHVTSLYDNKYDSGILWNSVGIPWPTNSPLQSLRDTKFLPLNEFESPF